MGNEKGESKEIRTAADWSISKLHDGFIDDVVWQGRDQR
jgi:hypothetical protein